MATPVDPQKMVDNATSAIAAKNASLGGRRRPPVANAREGAISRRLSNMNKRTNG